MEVSSAFVVVMGMGVTLVGLSCIIFLTLLATGGFKEDKSNLIPPRTAEG